MKIRALLAASFFCLCPSALFAQSYFWSGNGADTNFSTASNWAFSPIASGPDTAVLFGGYALANTSATTAVIDAATPTSGTVPAFELSQLNFGPVAIPYTISTTVGSPAVRFVQPSTGDTDDILIQSGRNVSTTLTFPITTGTTGTHVWTNNGTGQLTINGSVNVNNTSFTIQGTGNTTLNGNITLASSTSIMRIDSTGASTVTTINGNIALNNAFLTLQGAGNINFNGVISGGSNGVNYNGTGVVTLSGANTYNGISVIANTGTLVLSGGANRLPVNAGIQFNGAGTIDLNGNNQSTNGLISFVSTAGGAKIRNNSSTAATFTYAPALSQSFNGEIGGNLNVVLNHQSFLNTWTLTAANTYTGTTTIQNGRLSLSGAGSIANSSVITTLPNSTLVTTALTSASASFDSASGRFLVRPNQTLRGTGTVIGSTYVGPGATLSPGVGNATDTLTNWGGVRVQGGGVSNTAATWQVYAQDVPGFVRSNLLDVRSINGTNDSGNPGVLDLAVSSQKLNFVLNNAGGLTLNKAYSMTIGKADLISRDGVTLSTLAGGGTFTFAASDFTVTSASFELSDVSLVTNGGSLILNFTPVPEPTTVVLMAVGIGGVAQACIRSRRRAKGNVTVKSVA
ncbi:MAG: PEP-CTERM sorting domain-containing protein [Gemmataceae bacterium]